MDEENKPNPNPELEAEPEVEQVPEVEKDLETRVAELESELQRTRSALKKANREAAQRRHLLKEREPDLEEVEVLKQRIQELEGEVQRRIKEVREERQKQQVLRVATEVGFEFPEDLLRLGDIELDLEEDALNEEDIKMAARALARKRPGLLKKRENIPDTDAKRRGHQEDVLPIDEEQVARAFGIKNLNLRK